MMIKISKLRPGSSYGALTCSILSIAEKSRWIKIGRTWLFSKVHSASNWITWRTREGGRTSFTGRASGSKKTLRSCINASRRLSLLARTLPTSITSSRGWRVTSILRAETRPPWHGSWFMRLNEWSSVGTTDARTSSSRICDRTPSLRLPLKRKRSTWMACWTKTWRSWRLRRTHCPNRRSISCYSCGRRSTTIERWRLIWSPSGSVLSSRGWRS